MPSGRDLRDRLNKEDDDKFPTFSLKDKVQLFGKSPEAVTNPPEVDDEEEFRKKFGKSDAEIARQTAAAYKTRPPEVERPLNETPSPQTSSSSSSESSSSTRRSGRDPSAGLDKRMGDLEKRLLSYYEEANKLPPEDKQYFTSKLEDAKRMLTDKESELGRGELIEKLSQAFTQLGAGLYGLKTGTDLSGLKFDKTDFDKRFDRALKKYELNLSTIKEERDRRDREREFKARQAQAALSDYAAFQRWKEEQKARGVEHVDEMEYRREALDAKPKPEDKTEAAARKVQLGRLKDWESFLEDLQSDGKVTDPTLAMSQMQQKAARLGVDPKKITEIIDDESEFFEGNVDAADVRQVAARVNQLIDAQKDFTVVGGESAAPAAIASDMVKVRLPNGQTGSIPRANLPAALKMGAKEI